MVIEALLAGFLDAVASQVLVPVLVDVILIAVERSRTFSIVLVDAMQSNIKYYNVRVRGEFLPRLIGIWPCLTHFES